MSAVNTHDVLWDAEQQRAIIGMLVERLGGQVTLTKKDFETCLSASGKASLYVEYITRDVETDGPIINLEVLPALQQRNPK